MLSKVKQIGSYFGVMVSVLRTIMKVVESVEEYDRGEGNGEQKKELAVKIIGKIYEPIEDFANIPIGKEKLQEIVGDLIDLVVGFYNFVGRFRKSEGTPETDKPE